MAKAKANGGGNGGSSRKSKGGPKPAPRKKAGPGGPGLEERPQAVRDFVEQVAADASEAFARRRPDQIQAVQGFEVSDRIKRLVMYSLDAAVMLAGASVEDFVEAHRDDVRQVMSQAALDWLDRLVHIVSEPRPRPIGDPGDAGGAGSMGAPGEHQRGRGLPLPKATRDE